jgi:hypothetical protein
LLLLLSSPSLCLSLLNSWLCCFYVSFSVFNVLVCSIVSVD